MFVKKFEADTIEEALKAVKFELGPDAIILKTITNNGIKGAFKKKRIEITAAITEQNFEKKAKVDKVLNNEQKESFYKKPATSIQESINKYVNVPEKNNKSYGHLGLNKVVNTISKNGINLSEVSNKTTSLLKNSLDDFLTSAENPEEIIFDSQEELNKKHTASQRGKYADPPQTKIVEKDHHIPFEKTVPIEAYYELKQEVKTQQYKIDLLEKKLSEISQNLHHGSSKTCSDFRGLDQLRTTLKTLDVDDSIILEIIKKATFELTKEELDNIDLVFEFALKEMANTIKIDSPLFSKINDSGPVLTVLISETSSGQSSMCLKIAFLKKEAVIVELNPDQNEKNQNNFAAQLLGVKIEKTKTLPEMVGIIRKSLEAGKSVVLDLKMDVRNLDETKKMMETLRRGFKQVEVLGCISAIHSEIYNRKIIARYKDLLDGVIISHVDLCLSFGAIFNFHKNFNKLPLKFFGTGPVIPDDIEGATAERLMAGLFQF